VLWLLLPVVFLTALLSGMFGMAGGLILMGVFTALLPVAAAMTTHGLVQLIANGGRAVLHAKHIRWKTLGFYVIGSGSVALALTAVQLSPSKAWVYLLLGLAPMVIWTPKNWVQADAAQPVHAVLCGLFVTGFNLVAGSAGAMLDIFFVRTSLDRHTIVATKAATQTISHLAKIAFYGAPLILAGGAGLPPPWFFAVMVPVSLAGTAVGGQVLKRFSDAGFKAVTRYLVTAIGVVYLIIAAQLFLNPGAAATPG
jgi:uncharacterized membrane protein YfcA